MTATLKDFINSPLCRNGSEARTLLLISEDRDTYDAKTRVFAEAMARLIVRDGIDVAIGWLKGVYFVTPVNDPRRASIDIIALVCGLSVQNGDLTTR